MNDIWFIILGLFLAVVFACIAYAWLTSRTKPDDGEQQEEQKRNDDMNDEFTKRLHELHATRFGRPMVDPRTVKRNVVTLKDRQLTKRKKD